MQYPHRAAGRVAAPLFAAAGLLFGWFLWSRLGGSLPLEAAAAALIAAAAAYFAYSSQTRNRPPSVWQASVADGVVAGIVAGVMVGVIFSLVLRGAGTGHPAPSLLGDTVKLGAVGALLGFAGGGLLGWAVYLVGGAERLSREPPAPARVTRRPGRKRRQRR